MGGFFGAVTKENCVFDVFYGTDYHSHLGTRRAGMVIYDGEKGFQRSIHNIQNSPFRTKFADDVNTMVGSMGIGCISDYEAQPLLIRSKLGTYGITTVGKINNEEEILEKVFSNKTKSTRQVLFNYYNLRFQFLFYEVHRIINHHSFFVLKPHIT